jgi:hypothetical protein
MQIIWDLEDDPDGNYWHIVVEGHGVTQEEVDEVLLNRDNTDEMSRTSGNLMTFGWTSAGQYIVVVWELACDDPEAI